MKVFERRKFFRTSIASAAAFTAAAGPVRATSAAETQNHGTKMRFSVELGTIGNGSPDDAIKHCQDLGIDAISVPWHRIAGFREKGYVEAGRLKSLATQIEDAGLAFSAFVTRIPSAVMTGGTDGEAQFDDVRRSMESMAAVHGDTLAIFSPVRQETPWNQVVNFYGKLTEAATQYKVRIATHTSHSALSTYDVANRLFRDVPSPSNGLCFCTGNVWHGEGEGIYEYTRKLKDRIFFMHIRNVKTGMGEKEYWFDEGDIDFPKLVSVLKEIDYRGDLRAEHLPTDHYGQPRASDLSSTWTLGYMKALLQTV